MATLFFSFFTGFSEDCWWHKLQEVKVVEEEEEV